MAFTLAVTAVAFWFLVRVFRGVGLQNISERLMGADPVLVALAIAVTVIRFLLLALRWETFVRREAPIGLRQVTPVLMAGNFLGLVTPALRVAGPILRAYYLSRETGRSRARFYGTIVADQTSNFTIWAVAMSVCGVVVATPASLRVSPVLGGSMLAALIGGLSVGYFLLRRVHRGHDPRVAALIGAVLGKGREGGWRARVVRWWEDLVRALATSVIESGAWWPSLALSSLVFGAVVAVQVLSFAAVGRPIGATEVAFAIAGAGLLQVIAAAPGVAGTDGGVPHRRVSRARRGRRVGVGRGPSGPLHQLPRAPALGRDRVLPPAAPLRHAPERRERSGRLARHFHQPPACGDARGELRAGLPRRGRWTGRVAGIYSAP